MKDIKNSLIVDQNKVVSQNNTQTSPTILPKNDKPNIPEGPKLTKPPIKIADIPINRMYVQDEKTVD